MPSTFLSDTFTAITSFSAPVTAAFSLTILGGFAIGRLKLGHRAREAAIAKDSPPSLPRELLLPVVHQDPDHIARAEIVARISDLVLTGDWNAVTSQIAEWEGSLKATQAGARFHDIATETCLAPLQNLIDEAPRQTLDDMESGDAAAAMMLDLHRSAPDDHILATLAARAHMLLAETCSAEFWPESETQNAWRHMAHHYLVAEEILAPFDPVACMSPLLGATAYRLELGMPGSNARVPHAFEDWIDLDPSDPAIYACHAETLLAETGIHLPEILREANRAEDRTRETLGQAGYALFVIPLLDLDDGMREHVSPERLAAGLMDMARFSGTQAEVNWAAACLAKESAFGPIERRSIMLSAFDALVRRHLGVIYPRLWEQSLIEIRAMLKRVFESETLDPSEDDPAYVRHVARAAAA